MSALIAIVLPLFLSGPLVYGIAFCSVDYEDTLKDVGFDDSKALTAESRQSLLEKLISLSDHLAWSVRVMAPQDISAGMLKSVPYNLNAQSHDATFSLITDVMAKGVQLEHVRDTSFATLDLTMQGVRGHCRACQVVPGKA